jgi:DNA-binding response OmpR family regulator
MGRKRSNVTKVLIVEDDISTQEVLTYNLRHEGYTPIVAPDATSALRLAREMQPALILLDLMLPGGSGFDVCRDIRDFSSAPIIMVTARGEDIDRILGLEIGADDYVTKPFHFRELLARMRANLRRVVLDQNGREPAVLGDELLSVDVAGRRVLLAGTPIALQPKEFDLLVYLMRHEGTVMNRDRLLQGVWGHDFVGQRTVDVHVRRLRAKLSGGGADDCIRTVHGVGYVFSARAGTSLASAT